MKVRDCVLVDFQKIADERGSLSVVECHKHIPFTVQRVFYIYGVSTHSQRGGHAHYQLHEVIIPIVGSFNVKLHDGYEEKIVTLNKPNQGLYLPPLVWVELSHFSADAVCLVLASENYNKEDYVHDYELFLQVTRGMINADSLS